MVKPTGETMDFKAAFETAEKLNVTVMEGGQMEDYFQITIMKIQEQLADYAEFSLRCVKAGDLVGIEEVKMNMANLATLTAQISSRVDSLHQSMLDEVEANRTLTFIKTRVKSSSESLSKLFEHELGMTVKKD